MDANQTRCAMASQAAAMVVVMVAFLSTKLKRVRRDTEPVVYGPRLAADEHR